MTGRTSRATARSTVGVRRTKRETVETIMGVVYETDDGWETVWRRNVSGIGGRRRITGRDADLARYLAIYQSTSEGGRS